MLFPMIAEGGGSLPAQHSEHPFSGCIPGSRRRFKAVFPVCHISPPLHQAIETKPPWRNPTVLSGQPGPPDAG